jgi:hypothetical protein
MTNKEAQLEMLKYLLTQIKGHIHPDLDIMGFSHYSYEEDEYDKYYTGPGTPTMCDWRLVDIFINTKHIFEYSNNLGLSFDMEIYGE